MVFGGILKAIWKIISIFTDIIARFPWWVKLFIITPMVYSGLFENIGKIIHNKTFNFLVAYVLGIKPEAQGIASALAIIFLMMIFGLSVNLKKEGEKKSKLLDWYNKNRLMAFGIFFISIAGLRFIEFGIPNFVKGFVDSIILGFINGIPLIGGIAKKSIAVILYKVVPLKHPLVSFVSHWSMYVQLAFGSFLIYLNSRLKKLREALGKDDFGITDWLSGVHSQEKKWYFSMMSSVLGKTDKITKVDDAEGILDEFVNSAEETKGAKNMLVAYKAVLKIEAKGKQLPANQNSEALAEQLRNTIVAIERGRGERATLINKLKKRYENVDNIMSGISELLEEIKRKEIKPNGK